MTKRIGGLLLRKRICGGSVLDAPCPFRAEHREEAPSWPGAMTYSWNRSLRIVPRISHMEPVCVTFELRAQTRIIRLLVGRLSKVCPVRQYRRISKLQHTKTFIVLRVRFSTSDAMDFLIPPCMSYATEATIDIETNDCTIGTIYDDDDDDDDNNSCCPAPPM
jgi:hypothetical protein